MVPHTIFLPVKPKLFDRQLPFLTHRSFPLHIVFRIFDNCLASGIEAIFGFALSLLQKNEARLLSLKFDELVAFLNSGIIDVYQVSFNYSFSVVELSQTRDQLPAPDGEKATYRVDNFVNDAMSLRITPFMLDSYTHEYTEMIRAREAHAAEMDSLRNHNRQLSAQVYATQYSFQRLGNFGTNLLL
jgi:hypothetical protein